MDAEELFDEDIFAHMNEEDINWQTAAGILSRMMRNSAERAIMELIVYDSEEYQIPILKSDNKIYPKRIVAINCRPHFETTQEDFDDFAKALRSILMVSKDGSYSGYVNLKVFNTDDMNLQEPTKDIKWKIKDGLASMTNKKPFVKKPKY